MSKEEVIRAWKDEGYRNSLSAEDLGSLPENPAGMVELPDETLNDIHGGTSSNLCWAVGGYLTGKAADYAIENGEPGEAGTVNSKYGVC